MLRYFLGNMHIARKEEGIEAEGSEAGTARGEGGNLYAEIVIVLTLPVICIVLPLKLAERSNSSMLAGSCNCATSPAGNMKKRGQKEGGQIKAEGGCAAGTASLM